ncbi:hypothetical protein ANN_24297 [Periplaneta americana]|uniref:Per a allergen n=1 Tax=Periplaneta americana TaxID=6978 RepID=A0ABQ8S3F8_PERAM|nr:hypothetical protein ANN_24297 [Periplaneta americana]
MAGLCEGGNEPPGSLKAKLNANSRLTHVLPDRTNSRCGVTCLIPAWDHACGRVTMQGLLGGWSQRELLSAGHQSAGELINTGRSPEGKKYLPSD